MNKNQLERARTIAFTEIYGVSTQKEILELFRNDCIEHKKIKNDDEAKAESATALFSKYVLAITHLYSLSSIKTNLKAYKKIIKELRLGSIVQDKFYFQGLSTAVSKRTNENIEAKKETNKKMPFDVEGEIRRVDLILKQKSYKVAKNQNEPQVRSYYLAYIVGLATGRRFTEVLKTMKLVKRGDKIYFQGLLKKKDTVKNKLVEAHILGLSFTLLKSYIKELREYIDKKLKTDKDISLEEVSEQDINTIFSRVYNNAVKRISDRKVPNFHELRHFYTIEHQERYMRHNPQLQGLNFSDLEVVLRNVRYTVLAHEVTADSTFSYVTIK
jgi:hypothetical protein